CAGRRPAFLGSDRGAWPPGARGPRDAVPALAKVVQSGREDQAIEALLEMGPAAGMAVPALIEVVKSDLDRHVRYRALEALARIGPDAREAIPALIALLKQSDSEYTNRA